jgi:anthranilate synthase component 1
MYFATLAAFDHVQHRLYLIANVLTEEEPGSLRAQYDAAVRRLEELERRLERPLRMPPCPPPRGKLRVRPNMTPAQYQAMVERTKEYIRAGDIFQCVLSQRLEVPVRVPPFEVYRALRVVNPSPYMYFLRLGEITILGSSPEMLVKVTGRQVEYRPIAGTRPRGATEEEDLRFEQELRADEKERAEHIMLVDLGRNDVGRVCDFSTVRPKEVMFVERYSHVMHLVSSIQGTLRKDADSFRALAACFPAGTLTGAPKVRAMEIIDELEPTRRGLYGGAILYVDFSGNLNSCIVIRTVLIKDRQAYLQAGAGIVADSIPAREHQECMNKARAVLAAFEMAERGL